MMRMMANADPIWRPPLWTFGPDGVGGVRFPAILGRDHRRFVRHVQDKGAKVLLVVTDQWLTAGEQASGDYSGACHRLREFYPTVTDFQIENEVDHPEGAGQGSGPLPQPEYQRRLYEAVNGLSGDVTLYGAGAAHGDANYFRRFDFDFSMLSYFAVHMATVEPWGVERRCAMYRPFDLPLVVTECYAEHNGFSNEGARAQYVSGMATAMANAGIVEAWFYSLTDKQYGGGLVKKSGSPWESWSAWVDAGGVLL